MSRSFDGEAFNRLWRSMTDTEREPVRAKARWEHMTVGGAVRLPGYDSTAARRGEGCVVGHDTERDPMSKCKHREETRIVGRTHETTVCAKCGFWVRVRRISKKQTFIEAAR